MIQLRVRWPNPGHVLLANPQLELQVDGAPLQPLASGLGTRDFQIPDGAARVELQASFTASLPAVGANLDFILWEATQSWTIDGDALVPEQAVLTDGQAVDVSRAVHPLVQTSSAANALSGVAVVELRTEFVDITDHWFLNAPSVDSGLNAADQEDGSQFVALAATGAQPPLWFAHFPRGLEPPAPETSVLAFFRPHGHYSYTTAFDPAHSRRGLQDLNRYILAPKDHGDFDIGNGPQRFEERFPFADTYYPLRVGFQQAVLRSEKPLVVLHPWPTGGLNFGDALTPKLPGLIDQVLRFLQGTARIGANQPDLTLGRFGVAGYSAGGPSAVQAMKANRSRVKEMYLFDPFPFVPEIPFVVDWAFKTQDFRLRMTGANFWGQMETVRRTVVAGVTGEAGDDFVTLRPTSPSFYKPEAQGGGHYWNYVVHTQPALVSAPHVQHQFAIFGGDFVQEDADFNMVDNVTWLEEFLSRSGF